MSRMQYCDQLDAVFELLFWSIFPDYSNKYASSICPEVRTALPFAFL